MKRDFNDFSELFDWAVSGRSRSIKAIVIFPDVISAFDAPVRGHVVRIPSAAFPTQHGVRIGEHILPERYHIPSGLESKFYMDIELAKDIVICPVCGGISPRNPGAPCSSRCADVYSLRVSRAVEDIESHAYHRASGRKCKRCGHRSAHSAYGGVCFHCYVGSPDETWHTWTQNSVASYTSSFYPLPKLTTGNAKGNYKYAKEPERVYGIEIEVEPRDGGRVSSDTLDEMVSDFCEKYDFSRFVVISSDASVRGFEMKLAPMSIEWLEGNFDKVAEVFRYWAVEKRMTGHNSLNAGMHVHVPVYYFRNRAHVLRFLAIWNHPRFALSASMRHSIDHMEHYAEPSQNIRFLSKLEKQESHDERFSATNVVGNKPTIEIRIFQSTLNLSTIYRRLCLIDEAIVFTMPGNGLSNSDLDNANEKFIHWLEADKGDPRRKAAFDYYVDASSRVRLTNPRRRGLQAFSLRPLREVTASEEAGV